MDSVKVKEYQTAQEALGLNKPESYLVELRVGLGLSLKKLNPTKEKLNLTPLRFAGLLKGSPKLDDLFMAHFSLGVTAEEMGNIVTNILKSYEEKTKMQDDEEEHQHE